LSLRRDYMATNGTTISCTVVQKYRELSGLTAEMRRKVTEAHGNLNAALQREYEWLKANCKRVEATVYDTKLGRTYHYDVFIVTDDEMFSNEVSSIVWEQPFNGFSFHDENGFAIALSTTVEVIYADTDFWEQDGDF
jgi:hypothetical protein